MINRNNKKDVQSEWKWNSEDGLFFGIYNADGTFIQSFGPRGSNDGELNVPSGLAIDNNGNLLVGDSNNKRICVFDRNYSFIRSFGCFSGGNIHLVVDSFDRIIASDYNDHKLQFFDSNYQLLSTFGSFGNQIDQFKWS